MAIPDYGACDVVVTPSNASTTLTQLNDSSKRVFCVQPGDYRSFGQIQLLASGTETQRRFLRFDADDGVRNAVQRPERAIFESIEILRGDWWVIQGLTIQPRDPNTYRFLSILNASHAVLDGNLVDGIDHVHSEPQLAVVIDGWGGEASTHNAIQRNLIRNGNQSRLDQDYQGIMIQSGSQVGGDHDFNVIVDNEVANWGDGVALNGFNTSCVNPASSTEPSSTATISTSPRRSTWTATQGQPIPMASAPAQRTASI